MYGCKIQTSECTMKLGFPDQSGALRRFAVFRNSDIRRLLTGPSQLLTVKLCILGSLLPSWENDFAKNRKALPWDSDSWNIRRHRMWIEEDRIP